MASAGRILIIPKGDWNTETEYEMLDLVSHNGRSWLAKKNAVGIEPRDENAEYWQDMFGIDLTPYATKEDLSRYLTKSGGTLTGKLGFMDGRGFVSATDYGAHIQAKQDPDNYRNIRIANPMMPTEQNNWAMIVDVADANTKEYRLFGEHNIDLLKSLLGLN